MFKRITALILVLVLVIGMVPAAQAVPEATVDTSDVTIQGTNGFGNLLSQEINENQTQTTEDAAEYPDGYTVSNLEIEDGIATVTYDSMEEATLVVALYTEDGMRMVTSAAAAVTPDTTTATVTFEDDMPEYFLASAYLLDSYDLSPLCAAYDTPMYTREMQELLASTVDDYDPEKVLNLDDDETTNFAVYADSTIVIEAVDGKNTVTAVDDENATYVIENVDEQITSLVAGDVVAYANAFALCDSLKEVHYSGTEAQWKEIVIYQGNGDLTSATIHFNSNGPDVVEKPTVFGKLHMEKACQDVSITAVYPGDYGTEITEEYTLKTASFSDLVPGEQYVMLAMASVEVADPLAADNLLFIDQAAALEDGTLTFQYVQRTPCDISYVVACGASHKNLKDAEISFPEMVADGELQVVDPVVVYDGETLVEGRDYVVVGKVDFTEAGEYTCSIRGIHNYTGLVECSYTVTLDITEVASGWSGATNWTLTSDGTLTVYGAGNMKNYGYNGGQPWLDMGVDVTKVVIEEGVTAVGTGAFRNLTTLEAVTLPESGLSKIGEAAFYGCTSLREISIPEGVYTVWAYTFKNCSALNSVKLPKTLIKIDQGAFESCTSLPYISIPTNVEIIGSWSYKGCTALEEAEMTWANATEIREGAFKNCSALTTVHFPTGIQKFGDSAFYGIGAESFTVPATVTTVGPWCFARAHVKEITFEGDAPAIGEGAFNKITLTAFYPDGNTTWTADIMQNYGGTVTWTAN